MKTAIAALLTLAVLAQGTVDAGAAGSARPADEPPPSSSDPPPSSSDPPPSSSDPPPSSSDPPPSSTNPPPPPPTDPPPPSTDPPPPPTTIPFTCVGVVATQEAPAGDPRWSLVTDRSVNRVAAVGSKSGNATRDLQRRLIELGFWLNRVDGKYGHTTTQAVMAFQKYVGLKRTGRVDQTTADALSCSRFRAFSSISQNWTLVEVDKRRQLMFLIQNGRTVHVINTSTGSEKPYRERNKKNPKIWEVGNSVTPNGWHKVYWQWPNGWKPGDLGRIYRPKYIKGGIAIHGMTSVPSYPASHGCIRVSLPAMDMIWTLPWVTRGTSVWVHT